MKKLTALLFSLILAAPALAQNVTSLSDTTSAVGFHVQAIASSDHLSDKTDVSSLTCRRSKNGADAACGGSSAEVSDANHPGSWFYTLASGDIDTQGTVLFTFSASGMDNFRKEIVVGPRVKLSDSSIAAATYSARGTAQGATGTTLRLASSEAFADDELNDNNAVMVVSATSGAGQVACIRDYTGSTDTATVDTWQTTPTGTITYDIIPAPDCTIDAAGIAAGAITSSEAPNLDAAVSSISAGGAALATGTFQTGSTTGKVKLGSSDSNLYRKGQGICNTTTKQCSLIVFYDTSSKFATIYPTWSVAPSNGDPYSIYGTNYSFITQRRD